jgi:fimbrial chaperone protein
VKSGVFSVINSGNEKLNCQVEVKEWSQDADGKDVYTDTKDIIFFPRIMTIEPNEQRAIRVGIKVPASTKEKTYRIFVEEIPSQKKEPEDKTSAKQIKAALTIAIRYAVPIFIAPLRPQQNASIEKVDLSNGMATAIIKNAGNVHIKLLSVAFKGKAADGKELFSKDVTGWYVLQGLSRQYETTVPNEACRDLATIEVSAQTVNFTLNKRTLTVDRNMCPQ